MNKKISFQLNYCKFLNYIPLLLLSLTFHFTSFAEERPLPKELNGYQVKFDYKGYPIEREIAYQFYKKNYKHFSSEHPLEKSDIGIDLYDIDNNGEKEIITYLENIGSCGSRGCSFEILKPIYLEGKSPTYKLIPLGITAPENIRILDSVSLGYHDIAFTDIFREFDTVTSEYREIKFESAIWRWDGKKYDLYKVIRR